MSVSIFSVGLIVLGVGAMTLGADLVVGGASSLATRLGISRLVVGLTVVAFGTSLPELAVSIGSAADGEGAVALGNALGSNVFNILVVLGGASLVRPLIVHPHLLRADVPVMVGTTILVLAVAMDGAIGRGDGIVLAAGALLYTVFLIRRERRSPAEHADSPEGVGPAGNADPAAGADPDGDAGRPDTSNTLVDVLKLAGGLALLVIGAEALLQGATATARALGVSELVIGLTVVAAGTSLPELATSLVAAGRGMRDLAVGNVVGSNIFNACLVLGAAGIVSPSAVVVPSGALTFDIPVMVAASLACIPVFYTGLAVSRTEGSLLLLGYAGYLTYLVFNQADHAMQSVIRDAVLMFALPLLAVLGMVAWLRWWAVRQAAGRESGAGGGSDGMERANGANGGGRPRAR